MTTREFGGDDINSGDFTEVTLPGIDEGEIVEIGRAHV